jgi:hypothetical protein
LAAARPRARSGQQQQLWSEQWQRLTCQQQQQLWTEQQQL